MIIVWSVLAIVTMAIGHVSKTRRWEQFINVYEPVDRSVLLKTLSVSHTMNVIFPLRVGDIFRVVWSAKKMKNGYTLAIATVIVDLYLDVVTVGVIFQGLALWGNEALLRVAKFYLIILLLVLVVTLLGIFFRRKLKKVIQKVASIFNERIEVQLLYLSYTVIATFKDIIRRISKKKFVLYTVGMWSMYLLSYFCFSKALGDKYGISDIFTFVFSKNCIVELIDYGINGGGIQENIYFLVSVAVYMIISLAIIWIYSAIRKTCSKEREIERQIAKSILPHLSENDKLSFLEMYFADENIRNISMFLNINQDINILNDLSAGSNATTILAVNSENHIFYRKYAFAGEALKLKEQCNWLIQYKTCLPLPEICNICEGDEYYAYDMKYQSDAVSFFNYIHSMPYEASWNILQNALDILRSNLYSLEESDAAREDVEAYVDEKVIKNINAIRNGGKYIKDILGYDEIIINGVSYHNFDYYVKKINKTILCEIFKHDKVTYIHGDLTIENIICSQSDGTHSFYFIDPNTGNKLNTSFLDYAKLLQSLHGGYEFFMLVKQVSIEKNRIQFTFTKSQNYAYLYKQYDELLRNTFSADEVKSIYYHEIVHWLRLMPYKIRKNEKTAVVFYAGLIMIMDDIMKRFGD